MAVVENEKFPKGAWVRFMMSNRLVIGQVEYTYRSVTGTWYVVTDVGEVSADYIREIRLPLKN